MLIFPRSKQRQEHIRRLGEVSHLLVDAGLIVLATASDLTDQEVSLLKTIIDPSAVIIVLVGDGDVEADLYLSPDDEHNVDKILDLLLERKIVFWWNNGV